MNKIRISKRIKIISKLISPYKTLADVGCDHGYLILEALNNDLIDYAIGVDNKKMPLESAKENLKEFDKDKYDLILSDGIKDVPKGIDCLCILGMGGILINEILDNPNRDNFKRIILQANKNNYEVRRFMVNFGYKITNEAIIYDKKYYEVDVFEKGVEEYTELELKYGPINLKNKTKEFTDYLKYKIGLLKDVKEESNVIDRIKEMEGLL